MTAPHDARRSDRRLRGRVVTREGVLDDGLVVLHDDRISWVGPVEDWPHEVPRPSGVTLLPAWSTSTATVGRGTGSASCRGTVR